MMHKIQSARRMLGQGQINALVKLLKERWDSEQASFGLRRDLTIPFATPDAAIPITIRPLEKGDIPRILDMHAPGITDSGREERLTRLQMLEAGISTCYVAVTDDNTPCYMQWLIEPGENSKVQSYFKGTFPQLREGEVLLEGAFTPESFRSQGIMACAMSQLAERASHLGAHIAIRFASCDNIPSLKGGKKAGFMPYLTRIERWHYFRRELTFVSLPDGTPYPFDH